MPSHTTKERKKKDLLKKGAERPEFKGQGIRVETPEQVEVRKADEAEAIQSQPLAPETLQTDAPIPAEQVSTLAEPITEEKGRIQQIIEQTPAFSLGSQLAGRGATREERNVLVGGAASLVGGEALIQGTKLGTNVARSAAQSSRQALVKSNKANTAREASRLAKMFNGNTAKIQKSLDKALLNKEINKFANDQLRSGDLLKKMVGFAKSYTQYTTFAAIGVWFAVDNVMGGMRFDNKDLLERVNTGELQASRALETMLDKTELREYTAAFMSAAPKLFPVLWPVAKLFTLGFEEDQRIINDQMAQMQDLVAQEVAGEGQFRQVGDVSGIDATNLTVAEFEGLPFPQQQAVSQQLQAERDPSAFDQRATREDDFNKARQDVAKGKEERRQQ